MTATTEIKRKPNKISNDPISDYLTRIRNAYLRQKDFVLVPFSRLKNNLSELLQREGYISSFSVVDEEKASLKSIKIKLKYTDDGKPIITGLRRVSRPGLRIYSNAKDAPRVFNGLGICVISTSKGLKTDRVARKENIGGEILCKVW